MPLAKVQPQGGLGPREGRFGNTQVNFRKRLVRTIKDTRLILLQQSPLTLDLQGEQRNGHRQSHQHHSQEDFFPISFDEFHVELVCRSQFHYLNQHCHLKLFLIQQGRQTAPA